MQDSKLIKNGKEGGKKNLLTGRYVSPESAVEKTQVRIDQGEREKKSWKKTAAEARRGRVGERRDGENACEAIEEWQFEGG